MAWAAESVAVEDLRTALKQYQGMESLEVDFKQTKSLKDMDFKIESEGHMSLQMPDLVRWQLNKPSPLKVELNRDTITMETGGKSNRVETKDIPPAQRREFLNMLNWLKLDADSIAALYTVNRLGPDAFEFIARDQNAMFKTLEMNLNKSGHVKSMRFKEKSGDEMLLRFDKPKVKYAKKK